MRIGHGYDAHRFCSGRPLILGGVTITEEYGLAAHSDGDVLAHAVADAILGAAGLPDIGHMFPDTSGEYKNIYSMKLLGEVKLAIEEKGLSIEYVDCTVIAQMPKLAPHINDMRCIMASYLGISSDIINVKATTEEKMGFTGAKEGIAAHCVCLLSKQ
jgi:2-C-methyl-D-erythritol 2,4-cyclodiphosphate synthase